MHLIIKRRLSQEEIAELKSLIQTELSFKVRIRVNQQKYARGSFNILPPKRTDFSDEQLKEIDNFFKKNLLVGNPGTWQGVSYIYGLGGLG